MRLLLTAVAGLSLMSGVVKPIAPAEGSPLEVWAGVTFYEPTGNVTYSGEWPYEGSAGCSWDIPLYSILQLDDGRVVRCIDRGDDGFMGTHIDVFCSHGYSACMQEIAGAYGSWQNRHHVTVLSWGR